MRTYSISLIRTCLSLLGIFVLSLAGLSACGQGTSTVTGTPIVIGFSLSISGDFADDGKAMQQGYQLWADTVNKSTGLLGHTVTLDILHDNSDPKQVQANYEKLITKDHVNILFGPFSTLLTKTAACVAKKYGFPLLEGAGGGPSVFSLYCKPDGTPYAPDETPAANALHADNVFDVSLPVQNNLESFALYILSLPVGFRPLTAAYATENDPFTQPQVDLVRKMLEAGGVKSLYYRVYDPTTVKAGEYEKMAQNIMNTKAEIGVFGTVLPDITAFVQTFRKSHYTKFKAVIATAGPDLGDQFVKAVGGQQNAESIFVPNGWYPQADNYQNADMVAAYTAQYNIKATVINADVAEAYSVGQVMAQAAIKVNSVDKSKLLQAFHQKSNTFDSVQGVVKFDATGQNIDAQPYLFQWQKNQLIPVFPDNAAAAIPEPYQQL